MLADLDLLLLAVFCTADDLLPQAAKNARRILSPGRRTASKEGRIALSRSQRL
jgi:hypothetical protein